MIAICDKPKSKIHNEIQIKFLGRKLNYFLLRASGTFFSPKNSPKISKKLNSIKISKKGNYKEKAV